MAERTRSEGVKLIVDDKCLGMLEEVGEVFSDEKYQRCSVRFYRKVFSVVPWSKVKLVAKMLKAIHTQESKMAAREKAKAVIAELLDAKLREKGRRRRRRNADLLWISLRALVAALNK